MSQLKEKRRQEKECFDVTKIHIKRMNKLKVIMGYSGVFLLVIVLISCLYIFFNSKDFDNGVVESATRGFFIDLLALIFLIYKMVFSSNLLKPTIKD